MPIFSILSKLSVPPGFGLLRNSSGFVRLRRDKPPWQASLWLRQFPLRSAPMACPGVKKATNEIWLPLWSLVELVSPPCKIVLLLILPMKSLIIKIPFPYSAETSRIMETRQKWYKMVLLRCKMVLKRHLFYPLFSTFEYIIFSIRFVKDACT